MAETGDDKDLELAYMVQAFQAVGVKCSPKKVGIVIRLYEEIKMRGGDITLLEITSIIEDTEDDIKDRADKVKSKKRASKGLKQGDKPKSWMENNAVEVIERANAKRNQPRYEA